MSAEDKAPAAEGDEKHHKKKRDKDKAPGGKKSYLVCNVRFDVDEKYELDEAVVLGEGSFGTVCKATVRGSSKLVAIKNIKNVFENLIDAKRTLRELRLLSSFNHENIIRIRDIMRIPDRDTFQAVYIVTDLMDTDLHNICVSSNVLTDDHCKYIIYQILRALKYIHSADVLHRDLKPSNVLINSNSDVKVCDFGLARLVEMDGVFYTSYVATRWYRAPEIILEKGRYSKAVDVWSVGCILAEIVGRAPIFPGRDSVHQLSLITDVMGNFQETQIHKTRNPKARSYMRAMPPKKKRSLHEMYPTANPKGIDLLEKALQLDPDERISVDDALAHPYLAQLHLPSDEPTCDFKLDFRFEDCPLTEPVLRDLLYNEMLHFHPELGEYIPNKLWPEGTTPSDMELEQYAAAGVQAAMLETSELLPEHENHSAAAPATVHSADGSAEPLAMSGPLGSSGPLGNSGPLAMTE